MPRTKYPVHAVARIFLVALLGVYAVIAATGLVLIANFGTLFAGVYCVLGVWGVWVALDRLIWGKLPTSRRVERVSDRSTEKVAFMTTFQSSKRKALWFTIKDDVGPLKTLAPFGLALLFTGCCMPAGILMTLVG